MTMPRPGVFQFFRRGGALRRYHQATTTAVQHDPVLQLLPALRDVPLFLSSLEHIGPATVQTCGPCLTLHGTPGSGRSLALLHLAHHWLAQNPPSPLLLLPLTHFEASKQEPRDVLTDALRATGVPTPFERRGRGGDGPSWLLLIDAWEKLPPPARGAWRKFLRRLPESWPGVRMVVALPEWEAGWAGFRPLTMAHPDGALAHLWLTHLVPRHQLDALQADLAAGTHSPLLDRCRFLELALLAWTYPTSGMPATFAQLYERSVALARTLLATSHELPSPVPASAWNGHIHGYTDGHNPGHSAEMARPVSALLSSSFVAASLGRSSEQACALAAAGEMQPLTRLQEGERTEVVLMLVRMLPDPAPLYGALWEMQSSASASDAISVGLMRTLSLCVRECPGRAPEWEMRILSALADARSEPSRRTLLQMLVPVLTGCFQAAGQVRTGAGGEAGGAGAGVEAITSLLPMLAPLMEPSHLLALLDDPSLHPAVRWAAADVLLQAQAQEPGSPALLATLLTTASPPDDQSRAARCYLLACGDDADRAVLADPRAAGWMVGWQHDRSMGQQRRTRTVRALLDSPTTPAVLRATMLALLTGGAEGDTRETLVCLCSDPDPSRRRAALEAVQNCPLPQAIAILGEVLLAMECPWEVQHDVLEHLKHVRYRSREGGAVLARCILSASMPVVGRLQALRLLVSRRQVGVRFLRQLVQLDAAHPVVRAVAIRLLVRRSRAETATGPDVSLVRELRPLLTTRAAPAPVRQEAAHALGMLVQGQGPEGTLRDEVWHALLSALSHPSIDTLRIAGIIRALGHLGEASVVPVLRAMFEPELSEYVRERWGFHAPRLAEVPVQEWPDLPLPRETRAALLTALTEGEADGEQPGSFSELVEQAVLRIRLAAADALVHIGSHSNDQATRQQVRMALFEALQTTPHPHELRELLAGLARVSETGGVDELQYLLSHPTTNITLRWLAVEQLGPIPDALPVLIEALEHRPLDPLTRGSMALALGIHGAPQAVPLLCRLAARRENDPHVRTQAVIALHCFVGLDGFSGSEAPAIAETLLAIVADTTAPLPLRSTAARTLPLPLHPETRRWLREVLRQEHQPPELIAGVLHSLGRDRDLEALTLMVRYAHSEYPTVALAALEALAGVGDESVAPLLIHLAQDTNLTQGVRLHAVVTLLRLGGAEYLPLLRQFLESEVLPLQLQALNCLLSLWPEEAQPMRLVTNATAPLALRLRALEEVTRRWGEGTEPRTGEEVYEEERSLSALLIDGSQPPRLRAALASICGQAGGTEAVRALVQSARDHTTPPYVRRLCIRALETHALRASAQSEGEEFSVVLSILGEVADRLASDDVCREWAMQALLSAMKMREE